MPELTALWLEGLGLHREGGHNLGCEVACSMKGLQAQGGRAQKGPYVLTDS